MKNGKKSAKMENLWKRYKISQGIPITKLHTNFHWDTINSLGVMRNWKKLYFFYGKMAKNGENRFFLKTQKNVPRHCHKEAAYQISLSYDKYFLSYQEVKILVILAGGAATADAIKKSQKTSRGIAIRNLHTKFHWATTNTFWVIRK